MTSSQLLRPGEARDVEAIRAIYNRHIREGVATFDLEEKSPEDRALWFAAFGNEGPHRLVVIEDEGGGILGYASSAALKPKAAYASSVEVSVYLRHGEEGRGLGRMLYARLFETLAATALHRAYAAITYPNPASIALHCRFGFEAIGRFREVGFKFGAYHDVEWYELDLDRWRRERCGCP